MLNAEEAIDEAGWLFAQEAGGGGGGSSFSFRKASREDLAQTGGAPFGFQQLS